MRNTIPTALMVAAAASLIGTAPASTPAPTPTGSRCIDVKPICDPASTRSASAKATSVSTATGFARARACGDGSAAGPHHRHRLRDRSEEVRLALCITDKGRPRSRSFAVEPRHRRARHLLDNQPDPARPRRPTGIAAPFGRLPTPSPRRRRADLLADATFRRTTDDLVAAHLRRRRSTSAAAASPTAHAALSFLARLRERVAPPSPSRMGPRLARTPRRSHRSLPRRVHWPAQYAALPLQGNNPAVQSAQATTRRSHPTRDSPSTNRPQRLHGSNRPRPRRSALCLRRSRLPSARCPPARRLESGEAGRVNIGCGRRAAEVTVFGVVTIKRPSCQSRPPSALRPSTRPDNPT